MEAGTRHRIDEKQVLGGHGLASATFTLQWADAVAGHEEEMHVENFSVWREADFLPPAIGARIAEMRAGDLADAQTAAGEATGTWDAAQELAGSPSGFDRSYRRGLHVEPRNGRFYPRGFFHAFRGIVREGIEPARIRNRAGAYYRSG
jgi:hypothetical protein